MLRPLSTLESFYADHAIAIVTVSDLKGTVNALILQKAIETVVMMHPLLSSEIHSSDEGYSFAKRSALDDQVKVLGKIDKDKRKQVILSELNNPLTNNSLIRCTLLLEERVGIIKSQHISFITTTHHAVSDGISCVALHQQIWKTYTEMANHQSPSITPSPLMPAIDDLIPTHFTEAELKEYIEQYHQTATNQQVFTVKPAELGDMPVELGYVRKKFTLKQTKSILEACKTHHVSVHGAICAANLLAMRDVFGTDNSLTLSCHSPINIRPKLEPAIENNAMFSAAIGCLHIENVTADMSLWALGENVSNTIKSHIASGDIFKSMLTYQATRLKSPTATTIGITNVGKVEVSLQSHKLKFLSIGFIPRIPLPMLTACVITSGNKLVITYPYAKPYYSGNLIKKIAERAGSYLSDL